MIEYHVVSAFDLDELEKRVGFHVNDGWELQGGVSAIKHSSIVGRDELQLFQAMKRYTYARQPFPKAAP